MLKFRAWMWGKGNGHRRRTFGRRRLESVCVQPIKTLVSKGKSMEVGKAGGK